MYVNKDYKNYKYIVEISDNYIVLTDEEEVNGTWESPQTYNVIYQYLKPSILCIEEIRTTRNNLTFEEIEIKDNYWERADCLEITNTSILLLIILLIFINGITKLVKKGGLIFGQ